MKFPKPLIVLMNTDRTIAQRLQDAGYNVEEGSFGTPYTGPADAKIQPLYDNSKFPAHFSEAEIVVIDLSTSQILDSPVGQLMLNSQGNQLFLLAPFGVVDPRPVNMLQAQEPLNRIFGHGGIFIIFAEPKIEVEVYILKGGVYAPGSKLNNWQFLLALTSGDFVVVADRGTEIQIAAENASLAQTLKRYFAEAHFSAVTKMFGYTHDRWKTIATNKFGQNIAGIYSSSSAPDRGIIFVLPHPSDKTSLVLDLIENILPEMRPQLFPFLEETHWIKQDIYQPSEVLALRHEIEQTQRTANEKVNELLQQIETEQAAKQYLADLITQTDEPLVLAVKQALEILGFQDVLNYDEELEKRGIIEMREDLHIRDRSPLILVEVKGVKGTSTEDAALQVTRYLFPRAQELNRTDLRGLSIINHQRHLPPLERQARPFHADVLTNAIQRHCGLLTAWNLYKLVRNYLKHEWTHDLIAELFYKDGFIEPIPLHYQYIGTVQAFAEKFSAVGLLMKEGELHLGDRIAFELPIDYEEQQVDSLEVDNQKIDIARVGMHVGIKTPYSRAQLKDGIRVFRII